MGALTALVLAGTRPGGDPLAAHAGVRHKALIEIAGRTMIERVVQALDDAPAIGRIIVSIEQPEQLAAMPFLLPGARRRPVTVVAAAAGPSASVAAVLAAAGAPLLVTTADHAMLQPDWIQEFLDATPADADAAIALARRERVLAAAPDTIRTWLRFTDGDYSGCNLFLLRRPAAGGVVELWRQFEAERRRPLAMMRRLGPAFALRYRFGWLRLAAALAQLQRLSGARVAVVEMGDGRAAIDVDKPADLELARRLMAGDTKN